MDLALDPVLIVLLAGAEALYLRAAREVRRRGLRLSRGQQALWHAGLALEAFALLGPLDHLGEDLLSAHMGQHLLMADLGAPLLLAGARAPILLFLLPRPALVGIARRRRLRATLRWLRRPLVAVPVYLGLLYAWHLGFLFEAALEHPLVHVLQHQSFLVAGVLVWWPALEPQRTRPRGELWKIPYVLAARLGSMFVGMAFLLIRTPAYAGWYGERPREHGLSPLADQQLAGGLMMTLDVVVMALALCFFFWLASREDSGEAGPPPAYSTVSVPSMPPSRWPGTEQ
jgi:putative copper resistance protein D